MKSNLIASVILLSLASLSGCCQPVETDTKAGNTVPEFVVKKTFAPVKVDGKLDDECWKDASRTALYESTKDRKWIEATGEKTSVRFAWDNRYFYIAVEAEDSDIWAQRAKHDDALYQEEALEIFLRADREGITYHEIEVNLLGNVMDLMNIWKNGRLFNFIEWDCKDIKTGIKLRGTLKNRKDKDKGYTMEVAIPWQAIPTARPLPPRNGDVWFGNVLRLERKDGQPLKLFSQSKLNRGWAHDYASYSAFKFVVRGERQPAYDILKLSAIRNAKNITWRLENELDKLKVDSPKSGAYIYKDGGWHSNGGYGGVKKLDNKQLAEEKSPAGTIHVHPRADDDPTIFEFKVESGSKFELLYRIPEKIAKKVDVGTADGVGLQVECLYGNKTEKLLETVVNDNSWRHSTIRFGGTGVRTIRITADRGPGNLVSDWLRLIAFGDGKIVK